MHEIYFFMSKYYDLGVMQLGDSYVLMLLTPGYNWFSGDSGSKLNDLSILSFILFANNIRFLLTL